MLWPTLSSASLTVRGKWPGPEPIAGVTVSVPFQFVPLPLIVTGTFAPIGGPKLTTGVVPGLGASVRRRFTVTVVSLVACMGGRGAVLMTPDGGVTSMLSAAPDG